MRFPRPFLRGASMAELERLRTSLERRIQARQGQPGVVALRHRLYAVTHEILARGGKNG